VKVEGNSFDVQGTMAGEKVAMQMSAEDSVHLMGLFIDLYENRLLAVIREYSTNARDAHIEAGVSLPIEITLPSSFAPSLSIRDFGTGLSAEDIREIYSQYGRSTKRDTNDQVGMMGIGCKSALTYTTQFTVSSTKDGRRLTVLVSRDEDGAGQMQILGDTETDEANGTEIVVAIRRDDIHRCADLCREFFSYWESDTVTINGRPPVRFEGLAVGDSIFIIEGRGQDQVVMGNVAYPTTLDIPGRLNRYGDEFRVVAFVGIGAVKPTPSREALMDTTATKAALNKVVEDYKAQTQGAIQKAVDACSTPQEAIQTVEQWGRFLAAGTGTYAYHYKGNQMPLNYTPPTVPMPARVTSAGVAIAPAYQTPGEVLCPPIRNSYYGGKKSYAPAARDIPLKLWPTSVWVSDYTPAKFTAQHKAKLMQWLTESKLDNMGLERFVLCPGPAPKSVFIDPTLIVAWETIKAVKLPVSVSSAAGYKKIAGSYNVYTEDGWRGETLGSDIRQNHPLFYRNGNQYECQYYADALKLCYPKFTLVCLPANRIAKFKRDASSVKEVNAGVVEGYAKWEKTVAQNELQALAMHDASCYSTFRTKIDASKVNDPALKSAVKLAGTNIESIAAKRRTFQRVLSVDKMAAGWTNPLDNYPLFDIHELRYHPDDMYLYLNAKYAQMVGNP
jgi:hypothetical protein